MLPDRSDGLPYMERLRTTSGTTTEGGVTMGVMVVRMGMETEVRGMGRTRIEDSYIE